MTFRPFPDDVSLHFSVPGFTGREGTVRLTRPVLDRRPSADTFAAKRVHWVHADFGGITAILGFHAEVRPTRVLL